MGSHKALSRSVWSVLRVTMCRPIDIQLSQNEYCSRSSLEFQGSGPDLGTLKIEKEPLTSIDLEKIVALPKGRAPKLNEVMRRIKLLQTSPVTFNLSRPAVRGCLST